MIVTDELNKYKDVNTKEEFDAVGTDKLLYLSANFRHFVLFFVRLPFP